MGGIGGWWDRRQGRARGQTLEGGATRQVGLDGGESVLVRGAPDVVRPHHERVLAGLAVIVTSDSGRGVPEPAVHGLSRFVAGAHLERDGRHPPLPGLGGERQHEAAAHLVPAPVGMDRDGRDVTV
jgi:hypothetical protein